MFTRKAPRAGRAVPALDGLTRSLVLSVSAISGGVYLMSHAESAMPSDWLASTPFGSWWWPGVALIVLNGLAPAIPIAATLSGARPAARAHFSSG